MSIGPAAVPVQSTPVVAVVSVPSATRDVSEHWNLLDEPPPLIPVSDDDDSDDEVQPRASIISDDDKKRDPRSQFYLRSTSARQKVAAVSRSNPAAHQVPRPSVPLRSPARRTSSQQLPAEVTHVTSVTPVISAATTSDDIVLYLDTGASSNAFSIHDVHDIPTREIIGVGKEDCTQAGILQHFGPALIVPSLSIHIISASVQVKRGYDLNLDNVRNSFSLSHGRNEYIFTHRPNGLYGYNYARTAAHVHLKLDRLINGRYNTAEQQRRAAAGQAFHCSTGHTNFQYLRFA